VAVYLGKKNPTTFLSNNAGPMRLNVDFLLHISRGLEAYDYSHH